MKEKRNGKSPGANGGSVRRSVRRTIYELGQYDKNLWWCRDTTRPGLLITDDGNGTQFDFPQDALQACCDAAIEYDALKRPRKSV